jgi:hypothetical protein
MNPRHAAVLAIVGWYLMLPPMDLEHNLDSDSSAPISLWTQFEGATFSTLAECEARKEAFKQEDLDQIQKDPDARRMFLKFIENADKAECVKSDDPRLANHANDATSLLKKRPSR